MIANWISVPALFSVHIGFAALFGAQFHRIRAGRDFRIHAIPLLAGVLLLMAAIWAVPLSTAAKFSLALASTLAAAITAFRFERISIYKDWAWTYAALSMGLILLWSITQGQALVAVTMSMAAAVALALVLVRVRKFV